MKKRAYKIVLILIGVLCGGFAEAQQLESYIQEAESNNPDIQAYKLRYNIAEEKVNEVNELPNTEFGAGYFISEPETRTGAQRARFSVKQMLPWFGTITARENYASSMADAEYVEIAIAKRKLALSVSQSYYQLYAITAKQQVLEQNIQLLETYESLALTSVEVGKSSAVDVLRLLIRKNELEKQKEILGEDFLAEKAQFNNLLNKDEKSPISVVDTMFVPLESTNFSSEGLKLHPEILKYDKLFESIAQSEALNQKESLPNIGVGLDYIPVAERPAMNFSDNGKDILMPMLSISVPIFNNKYSSITKQNELRQQEIKAQKQDRLNKLKTLFAQAVQNRNSARISYATQLKNLKQANDAEDILMKSYETGTIDFNDVLDIQELQLKFQMNQIESIKMYFVQSAIINYLTK
ncbi:TolC family protein [Leeuwenhoekiella sp. A16]|uniref:TolC family protein n=1 Tax=unclassified Leeuwenhoekiella TaxID=2615029 RepID=UPI003A802A47